MRIAIVTESFLPRINGVTNSVLRTVEHLHRRGHTALVIAPGDGPRSYDGARVIRTSAVALPGYAEFPVGLPTLSVRAALEHFRPDVVHLASPIALGMTGAVVSRRMGIPSVAVYQTDVAGFAGRYGLGATAPLIWRWLRLLHRQVDVTLAPSSHTVYALRSQGIADVHLWQRGVDTERFSPIHRDDALRRQMAPGGETIVGYVGRLANEKRVHLLGMLAGLPGVRVVVVGDGPARASLQRSLPDAVFLGCLTGRRLSRAFAALDVFVHPGADETFCQAAQEALASGVPVVAPAAGGLVDRVQPGRTGLLCSPDEPAQLRDAVASLLEDRVTRERMGRAARASVVGRTWTAVGDQLIEHYAGVIRRPRREEHAA